MADSNPLSVEELGSMLNGTTQATPIASVQATPQTALQQQFMQTPGYQLAYGNNISMDPNERFLNDPGVQMAIKAGKANVTNAYAAKGLGNSGALSQALTQYMYNNYGNYIGGQSNLFKDYQTQLANLAQFGSTQTGGAQALDNAQKAAGLLGQAYLGTAQNLGNAQINIGDTIAQLLANQGIYGGNAYLGTGAAQANNLMQGMQLNSQITANQNAAYASYLGGQGAMQGAGASTGGSMF